MKRLLTLALLGLLAAVPARAQSAYDQVVPGHVATAGCPGSLASCFGAGGPVQYLAGSQYGLTVATATSLTVPAGASVAIITVEGQAVRVRQDGTAPTATVGMPIWANSTMIFNGPLANLQFIQTSATATLDVDYYR